MWRAVILIVVELREVKVDRIARSFVWFRGSCQTRPCLALHSISSYDSNLTLDSIEFVSRTFSYFPLQNEALYHTDAQNRCAHTLRSHRGIGHQSYGTAQGPVLFAIPHTSVNVMHGLVSDLVITNVNPC